MKTPETFGHWTVLDLHPGGHGMGTICTCRCQCGVVRDIPLKRLKHGTSRSCGCTRGRDVETTLSDLQVVAGKKSGTCLSTKYLGHHVKHLWKCERGHTWEATANSIKRGSWCPTCGGSRGEQLCRKVLERLFETPFKSSYPAWLINPNTNRRLQLDGYSVKRRIAFEYQGSQHYKEIPRFRLDSEALLVLQERDALKVTRCQQRGVTLIVIPTFPDGFTANEGITCIRQAVNSTGLIPTGSLRDFRFTLCTRAEDYRLQVKEAAEDQQWIIVSDGPLSAHTRMKILCDQGHTWYCRATNLLHGNAVCPDCREVSKRRVYRKRVEAKVGDAGLILSTSGDIYSESTVGMQCPKGHLQHWRAARILAYPLHCVECQRTAISTR